MSKNKTIDHTCLKKDVFTDKTGWKNFDELEKTDKDLKKVNMLKVTLTGVNLMGNNEQTLRNELGDNLLADISKTKDGIRFRSLCGENEVWNEMKAICTNCEGIDSAKPYRDSEMANDDPAERCFKVKPTEAPKPGQTNEDAGNAGEKDKTKESSATTLISFSAMSIFLLNFSL